ncbi:MAG: hypothetical protein IJT98_07120 [Prevotella sp.]|nr:hypothetical protein [Prevotella sp.]
MKKIYVSPTLEVVKIQTSQMIAASITDSTTGVTFATDGEAVTDKSGMDSRRSNIWDDDEE